MRQVHIDFSWARNKVLFMLILGSVFSVVFFRLLLPTPISRSDLQDIFPLEHATQDDDSSTSPQLDHYSGAHDAFSDLNTSSGAAHSGAPSSQRLPGTRIKGNDTNDNKQSDRDPSAHPISRLIAHGREEAAKFYGNQSASLEDAVHEYENRYGMKPPPHFDVWYQAAVANDVRVIDDYDTIQSMLLPFWGLSPAAIRKSVREALAADDFLMGIWVRDGEVSVRDRTGSSGDWSPVTYRDSIARFAQYLPDMDLAINIHDEPRVFVPFEDLDRYITTGQQVHESMRSDKQPRRGDWSERPADLGEADFDDPFGDGWSSFIDVSHQFTWSFATASCPPTTPVKALRFDGEREKDRQDLYMDDTMGFVTNVPASRDVCLSPSYEDSYGFFNRPNSGSITRRLVPILSPTKLSTTQDIVFPPSWNLYDNVPYLEDLDMPWVEKDTGLFWRGGTTSGFSEGGAWRRQNRQAIVRLAENVGLMQTLEFDNKTHTWINVTTAEDENDLGRYFDVHFHDVSQCAEFDCEEQRESFQVADSVPFERVYQSKFLLDMDGNSYSGRYGALMSSQSLVLKSALCQEWHDEWLTPWAHFIPLSLQGTELLEEVRYFAEDEQGQQEAAIVAAESAERWQSSMRRIDMEIWIFRLLLEYARLIDDNREQLGFELSSRTAQPFE